MSEKQGQRPTVDELLAKYSIPRTRAEYIQEFYGGKEPAQLENFVVRWWMTEEECSIWAWGFAGAFGCGTLTIKDHAGQYTFVPKSNDAWSQAAWVARLFYGKVVDECILIS